MTAPLRSMPAVDETIVVLRRHQDFAEVFRHMKEKWGLTNKFIDDAGGLAEGQTDKYLGPSGTKNWGPHTFDLFCEILAIEFHAKVDIEAAKRMAEVWDGRQPRWFPNAKVGRISRKLIDAAKPLVLQEQARLGGVIRASLLTSKQVGRISRKGGNARRRKLSKSERVAIARKGGLASAVKRAAKKAAAKAVIDATLPPEPLCIGCTSA